MPDVEGAGFPAIGPNSQHELHRHGLTAELHLSSGILTAQLVKDISTITRDVIGRIEARNTVRTLRQDGKPIHVDTAETEVSQRSA